MGCGSSVQVGADLVVLKRKDIEDKPWEEQQAVVLAELRKIYTTVVQPIEKAYRYDSFRPSDFIDVLLRATEKTYSIRSFAVSSVAHVFITSCVQMNLSPSTTTPLILFLGPFSAGKTTFINYLLGSEHLFTGPEPTTNKFTVVNYGPEVKNVSGTVLANNAQLPFKDLKRFGNDFLEGFVGLECPSEILKSLTLIDTPGILEATSAHKRSYDYIGVLRWFVERADLIFVMFDPTKLDAGQELRGLFEQLKGAESRIRIILNKADTVNEQQLLKVHGALYWNLSNLINTTEPPRVFVSSMWNQPYKSSTGHTLFDAERNSLKVDLLENVPVESIDRKVASLLRRTEDVLIHASVVGMAREKISFFRKQHKINRTIDNINNVMVEAQEAYKLAPSNFPPQADFREFLRKYSLEGFPKHQEFQKKTGLIAKVQSVMCKDIPDLFRTRPEHSVDARQNATVQGMLGKEVIPLPVAAPAPSSATENTSVNSVVDE